MINDMDKRRNKRINRRLIVVFGENCYERFSTTVNLSRTGIFIKTKENYTYNSEIDIVLATPDDVFYLNGVVKWPDNVGVNPECRNCDGIGIKLNNIPPSYIHFVDKMLVSDDLCDF
jgi:Tfp pilus assembly protein PilZ